MWYEFPVNRKHLISVILIFIFCLFFFSFRLLDVPRGITIDEAAFGYNASLIAETGRDENGRFLPVFVLSLEGRDWRQPVAQYLQVTSFKLFGRSLYNLKFVSVLVTAASGLLIYLLGVQLKSRVFGWLALLIFITSPIILIHSHLALDNIMPVPFILIWLYGLLKYGKNRSLKFLVVSGISLGIGFYAHKSMRSAASVWTLLTVFYLIITQIKNWNMFTSKNYRPVIFFLAAIAPFYLVSPILNYKYAGAVYGSQTISMNSLYDFFYFYISNFDLSFLFIKGDSILHHSTGKHGMFLLVTLPLFFYGLYKSFSSKNRFYIFLTVCFFTGPLLISLVGSIHRSSRIIFLAPIFSIIASYGLLELFKLKEKFLRGLMIFFLLLAFLNIYDFLKYYWYKYADDTYHIFYAPVGINAYKKLDELSKKENLKPLISWTLLNTNGDGGTIEDFSRSLYFPEPEGFDEKNRLPEGAVLLSNSSNIENLEKIETGVKGYFLHKY